MQDSYLQKNIDFLSINIKKPSNQQPSNSRDSTPSRQVLNPINKSQATLQHQQQQQITQYVGHQEYHINGGEYLKSAVYGGTDGVINALAVIIGGIASGTSPSVIFALGLSVVIGDGVGMGLGDYLSAKAQKQFIKHEYERQQWEVQNCLDAQKEQIVNIYKGKKYTQQQSQRLAQLLSTNKKAFMDVMMLEELGLVVNNSNPIICGIVNSITFMIMGFIPFIPYLVAKIREDESQQYIWVIGIGGVELFSLGFVKSMLIGCSIGKRFYSAFQTIFFAAVALGVGYGIGKIFEGR